MEKIKKPFLNIWFSKLKKQSTPVQWKKQLHPLLNYELAEIKIFG